MIINIRAEKPFDEREIIYLVKLTFKGNATGYLVNILRNRKSFINDLSLVAEINEKASAYILLNPVFIDVDGKLKQSLWLEPLCVHPRFQGKGIGSKMMQTALDKGKQLGFNSVFVAGNINYYSRFGFRPADHFGIESTLELPKESFLALELTENSLHNHGRLLYPIELYQSI